MQSLSSEESELPPMNRFETQRRVPGSKKKLIAIENRVSERVPFSAVAQLIESQSKVRISVRVADLSRSGCYVDTISAMPVGTKVDISIDHGNAQLSTGATVVYLLPGMGMGLNFEEMSPEREFVLNRWISEARGESFPVPQEAEVTSTLQKLPQGEKHVISRLIDLMIQKNLITQLEGTELLEELSQED
jgi:hypothetical protein